MVDFARMRTLLRIVPKACFELEQLMSSAVGGTTNLSDMPKGGSSGDKLERDVIRVAELREAYQEAFDELDAMKNELQPLLRKLKDEDVRAVMRLRYLVGYSPDEIDQDGRLPMSRATIYRMLRNGEQEVKKMQNSKS